MINLAVALARILGTSWGLLAVGLLLMGAGGYLHWNGTNGRPPERSELKQVAGVITGAMKYTRGQDVRFVLDISVSGGQTLKLPLSGARVTEAQVASIVDRPIIARIRGISQVWELTSGQVKLIDYEVSRAKEIESLASQAETAPYVGGPGVLMVVGGIFWLARKRAQGEAA